MKELLRTIRSSLFDPAFYERVKGRSWESAIKLFAVLGVIGIGISLAIAFGAIIPFAFSDAPSSLESAYPDDLVVTLANGHVSINQPQPYYIKNTLASTPKYLAIFDGDDTLSADLDQNSTYLIVKKSYVISGGSGTNSDQSRITSFARHHGTSTVDKADVVSWIDPIKPYFMPVVLFGGALFTILFTLVGALFWVIGHMIYVLIPAVLIFLFALVRGSQLKYRESYMIGLYASIPVAIFSYLLSFLSLPLPLYAYTLLLLLVAVVNIVERDQISTTSESTPSSGI